jgi:hypothetical protein
MNSTKDTVKPPFLVLSGPVDLNAELQTILNGGKLTQITDLGSMKFNSA